MKKFLQYPAVALLLAIIVIGSALLDYFVPPMGDDLLFLHQLGGDDYTRPDRGTVSFILAHIFGCNGRLFDYMGPVIINLLPRAIASAIMGLMSGVFFLCVLYACRLPRPGHQTLSLCTVFLTLLAMPWWDSMWLRVCQFNYLWCTSFCMLLIGLFFRDAGTNKRLLPLFILGVFAGASHEQTGVALSGAFFLWVISTGHYRHLSTPRKTMLAGLLAGTLMAITSPGIWKRAAQENYSPPFLNLAISTIPLLLPLLVIIAACLISYKGRNFILSLYAGEWGVMVNAAVLSLPIIAFSGIPGRTGFFPETALIAAMTIMVLNSQKKWAMNARLRAFTCALIIALVCVHFSVSVRSQAKLMREWEDVRDAFIESPDGLVFCDFTNRYDVSPFTLYRVKGVADADDWWLLHAMHEAYGDTAKVPIILPLSFKDKDLCIADSITDGNVTVYTAKPANTVVTIDDAVLQYYPGPSPRVVTAGRLADGRSIWVATPLVLDPGDYILPLKTPL